MILRKSFKKSLKLFTLLSLLLLMLLQPTLNYTVTQYIIKDLESNDETSFAIEAAAWTASRKRTTNVYYKCDTTYLLGGYGVLGSTTSPYQAGDYYQRVYTNLPLHNSIHFSLNFWAIDSWDTETFQMSFDGTIITGWTLVLTPFPADLCGVLNGSWRELPNILIYGTVAHRASTVTFRVISGLDEPSDNESFGFRELTFTFDQDISFTTSLCATAPIALPDKTCACTPGQFKDSTVSSCTTCPDPCLTCYGGTTSDCYACKNLPNVFYDGKTCRYCDSPCATCSLTSTRCTSCIANYYYFPSTNQCYLQCPWPLYAIGSTCYSPCAADQYVNPDKSCAASCSAPFVEGYSTTVVKICKTPCSPVEFLYWDGSCQHDCGSPLTVTYGIGNQKICNHNCGVNYLNFDGNCQATCDPPYIPRMQSGRLICMKPCPLNQYLYWNGDCLDSCTALLTPVTLSTGVRTCTYKCLDTEYLYWDSVCRADCPYPLRTRIEKGKKYCDYPTTTTNFLYWDGSSETGCVLPLKQRTIGTSVVRKFCDFACTEWEYLYWDNTCGTECGFPLKQRITKGRQYCDFPCTGTNSILYWDGSCQSSCVAPLTQRPEKSKIFCDYKCSDEDFLYADGSCAPTCDSPFTERTTMNRKFCDFPCSAPKPYRYWNDTCQPACNLPLVLSHKYSQPFCNFPCKDGKYLNYDNTCLEFCDLPLKAREFGLEKYCSPSCTVNTDFYYWNGSCISTCSFPLVQQTLGAQKWCVYPCKANQFLYIDGSCGDICDLGLIASEEAGFKYCNNPCYAIDEFLYWNGTCESSCDAPFRKESTSIGKKCKKPCDNDLFYYDEKTGICSESCNSPSQNKTDLYLVCGPGITVDEAASSTILDLILKAPSHTGEVTLVTIVKQMEYIRYIDMDVPPRLERFLQSKGRNILSLRYGQQDTKTLTKEFLSRPLPEVFEKRGVHSHFLINFWQEITSWIVVLIATVLFIILEGFCRMNGWVYARIFFEKLNVMTKWNFCLILIMTSVNDIIFYGIIELRSWTSGGGGFSTFSFEVSIVALGIFIGLIFGLIHFARALRDARERSVLDRSNEELQEFLTKRRDCQVLFRGFRDSTFPNRYFLVIYIIRMSLPALIAALLYKFPMVQIILYIVINFAMLAYIVLRRPLARVMNFVQLIIFETIMLIINICLLLLKLGYGDTHTKTLIGDFVIAGNSMINLIAIVFLAFKILGGIKILFGYLSNQPKKQWTIFLQLIPLYLQQGGMGFEEMFIDSKAAEAYNQDQYLIQDKEVTPEMLGRKTAKVKSGKIFPENAVDDLPSREKAARLYSRLKSQRELNDQASSNNLNLEENSPGSLVIHPQKVEEENNFDETPSYSPTIKGLDDGGERLLQNSNRGGSDDSPLRARKNIKRIQNLLNKRGTLDAIINED